MLLRLRARLPPPPPRSLSIPSLSNVALLVFIVYYMFSILAMRIFGKIAFTDNGLSRNANFRDWPTSILTLFRSAPPPPRSAWCHAAG